MSYRNDRPRRRRGGNWFGWMIFIAFLMMMSSARASIGFVMPLVGFAFAALIIGVIVTAIVRNISQNIGSEISRSMDAPRRTPRLDDDYQVDPPIEKPKRDTSAARATANRAIIRAGKKPDDWLLRLEDIGVLAYTGSKQPDIVRTEAVTPNTSHVRPFAMIDLPYKQGRGTIRFQLVDELGDKRYDQSKLYDLKEGVNFITPPTWLPLPENRTGGRWTLRINIGDRPLAVHEFTVREGYSGAIGDYLTEDGEIDAKLSKAIQDLGTDSSGISLDELLASQDDAAETMDNQLR